MKTKKKSLWHQIAFPKWFLVTTSSTCVQELIHHSLADFVGVQSLSCVWLFASPWTAAHQAFLSFTISWSLFKLMSMESGMPSTHLIFCCSLLFPQSFPESGLFSMSCFFVPGGPSTGASASVFPMNIQGWFPLRLTSWISLQAKGHSRVFSSTIGKHQFFCAQSS